MNDPVVSWITRLALAALFAWAARHKLSDLDVFEATLRDYRMLPAWTLRPAARLFVACEVGLVVALLLPMVAAPLAGLAALALLGLYTLAIAWNLARGRRHATPSRSVRTDLRSSLPVSL